MSAEAKSNNTNNDSDKSPGAAEDATMVSSVANASNTSSSDDDVDGLVVLLVSGDGRNFELPLSAAKDSGMVREALNLNENGEFEENDDEDHPQDVGGVKKKVDCIRVQSAILEKIVAFLKHNQTERMQDIPMQLPSPAVFEECVPQEWYRQLVNGMNPQDLFALVSAANYMNIVPLFDLASLRVTFDTMGKNLEEIHQYLGIPQLTAEDEEQARKDHPWIFEDAKETTS